jgi:hypothetical protein
MVAFYSSYGFEPMIGSSLFTDSKLQHFRTAAQTICKERQYKSYNHRNSFFSLLIITIYSWWNAKKKCGMYWLGWAYRWYADNMMNLPSMIMGPVIMRFVIMGLVIMRSVIMRFVIMGLVIMRSVVMGLVIMRSVIMIIRAAATYRYVVMKNQGLH